MGPNAKLTRVFPSSCPYVDPQIQQEDCFLFLLQAEKMSLAKQRWGTRQGLRKKGWVRNKMRGWIVSLVSWHTSLTKKRRVSQPQNRQISATSIQSFKDMQGSYWIICGPHASVSWSTHGSRKTMGQVTPVMPIRWPTATYPRWGKGKDGYLSQESFRRWRCGRTFLFPEGPSYFQIVMSCGKRWPKNRTWCSENSKNQFCWSVNCTKMRNRKKSIRLVNEKKKSTYWL